MTGLYSEWLAFYTEKVSSWMSLEELRAECGKLQTTDATSPEVLLIHAMHLLERYEQRNEAMRAEVERLRDELRDRMGSAIAQQPQQPAGRVHDLAALLVDELDGLVGESDGVSGLHLNGDVATWDELLPGGRFERLSSLDELRAALAKQPAAVDGAIDKARFERAPCYMCGYNGPGYYQPDTHPCAAKYHAAQQPAARPPKPTECMNGCPDRQVCDHCQWPPGPDQRPSPPTASKERAMTDRYENIRNVLAECRDIAMEWTMRGRIPECGKFGEIAQDLDALCAELEITDSERTQQPANDEVVFIDGVGAGRRSVESCRDGVQWIMVGDRVYWPLSESDAKRLQSACCGNGSFDGPATPAQQGDEQ